MPDERLAPRQFQSPRLAAERVPHLRQADRRDSLVCVCAPRNKNTPRLLKGGMCLQPFQTKSIFWKKGALRGERPPRRATRRRATPRRVPPRRRTRPVRRPEPRPNTGTEARRTAPPESLVLETRLPSARERERERETHTHTRLRTSSPTLTDVWYLPVHRRAPCTPARSCASEGLKI